MFTCNSAIRTPGWLLRRQYFWKTTYFFPRIGIHTRSRHSRCNGDIDVTLLLTIVTRVIATRTARRIAMTFAIFLFWNFLLLFHARIHQQIPTRHDTMWWRRRGRRRRVSERRTRHRRLLFGERENFASRSIRIIWHTTNTYTYILCVCVCMSTFTCTYIIHTCMNSIRYCCDMWW